LIATVKHTIASQIRAVLDDIGTDALHSREVNLTVTDVLRKYQCKKIIVDPVMAAISGDTPIKDGYHCLVKTRNVPSRQTDYAKHSKSWDPNRKENHRQ
jgi:hydroxymethylpyrimidine/phosphomethylpyrimidine kinase